MNMGVDPATCGVMRRFGALHRWVTVRQRLGIGDVDGGADASLLQRGQQRVRIHDRASRRVHQQRTLFHESQFPFADHVRRLPGERNDENDDVCRGQEVRQLFHAEDAVACRAGDADKLDPEGLEALFDRAADGAVADDEDTLAVEFFAEDVRIGPFHRRMQSVIALLSLLAASPDTGMPQIVEQRKIFGPGENGGDRPFRGRDGMDAARITENHVGRDELQQTIDAGNGGLSHAESLKKRELLLGLVGPGRSDPELDFDSCAPAGSG